jgi:hypothetical protein
VLDAEVLLPVKAAIVVVGTNFIVHPSGLA